jgi:hypothetical protein
MIVFHIGGVIVDADGRCGSHLVGANRSSRRYYIVCTRNPRAPTARFRFLDFEEQYSYLVLC